MSLKRALITAASPALAITVFGVIYGSLARSELGFGATLLSSLFIFSGSVQFTIAGLAVAGAGAGALIVGALTLNLRNLLLGAVLRHDSRVGAGAAPCLPGSSRTSQPALPSPVMGRPGGRS